MAVGLFFFQLQNSLIEDFEGFRCQLRFIRDKEGREVDFAILKDGKIEELIEVKFSDDNLSKSLQYYTARLCPQKSTQIVANLKKPYTSGNISVVDPLTYFSLSQSIYRGL